MHNDLKCHLLLIFIDVERNVKKSVPLESLKFGVCLQEKLPQSMYNVLSNNSFNLCLIQYMCYTSD